MTINELNNKHLELIRNSTTCSLIGKSHTKYSIQFAVEILEELHLKNVSYFYFVDSKIQELKQYLDEKI